MLPVAPHKLAEGADKLIIHQAVHVDLLVFMFQTGQAPDVSVWHRLHQAMAGEGLLVWVCCAQASVAVRYLTRDTRFDSLTWRILFAELAADSQIHLCHNRWAMVGVVVVRVVSVVGVWMGVAGSGWAATSTSSTCPTTTAAAATDRSSYCATNGGVVGVLRLHAPALCGGVGAAEGGLLEAVNDVL